MFHLQSKRCSRNIRTETTGRGVWGMGIYVRSGQMRKNQRNESNKVLKALAMANTQKSFTFHAASRTVMVKSNLNIDLSAYSIPDLAPCTPHPSFLYPSPWLESMNSALAANGTELFSAIDESKQTKTQSPTHTRTQFHTFRTHITHT